MELIDDRVRRMRVGFDMIHRLMTGRVERLPDRGQRRHALRAQKIEQRPHSHLDPVENCLGVRAIASRGQRAFEIVDNRQQVAEDTLALNPHRFLALLADSLARIFGLGESAQVLVLELGDFLLFLNCTGHKRKHDL